MSESTRDATSVSRRDFVAGVTALGAVWLAAASACTKEAAKAPVRMTHGPAPESPVPPPTLKHFAADAAADVEAITARIIPSDDTPGAKEAGVVFFIDNTLTTFAKDQAPMFEQGLKALDASVKAKHGASARFATITPVQQDALLRAMEKQDFFQALRFATIAGFLALPKYGGNKDYIGWKAVGQEHTFEHHAPFGWYDLPENQKALLGRVL